LVLSSCILIFTFLSGFLLTSSNTKEMPEKPGSQKSFFLSMGILKHRKLRKSLLDVRAFQKLIPVDMTML